MGWLGELKHPQQEQRLYGLFGWVHLWMVHRCLATNGCHSADAVREQCNNALMHQTWEVLSC